MPHDVFISYSSEDKLTADALCSALESRRTACWIAPRDVLPGVDYAEALLNAISGCRVFVLVLSHHSNHSRFVLREVERAISKGLVIIPFRIEDVPLSKSMEFFVSSQHWLDALTPPLERHLEKLADTVQFLLQNGQREQTSVPSTPDKPAAPALTFARALQDPTVFLARQFGAYTLTDFIGSGGSGLVYRGWNGSLGRRVCLKILYPLKDVPGLEATVLRGVRAVAALDDPHIVRIFDCAPSELADGKSFYLAMEFVEGKSLSQWIADLPNDFKGMTERFRMALDLTKALSAAHTCVYLDETGFEKVGVLHGDIKPANVMVRSDGRPVLLDFMLVDVHRLMDPGIVPEHLRRTRAPLTTAMGTPGFMAPEQEKEGIVTVRSDIYSLGVTFRHLFFGTDVSQVFSSRADDLGPLRDLLKAMTNESPASRPPNAAAVVDEVLTAGDVFFARQKPLSADFELAKPSMGGSSRETASKDPSGEFTRLFDHLDFALEAAASASQSSRPLDESVQFTVYRPAIVQPSRWHTLLAFAHLADRRPDSAPDEPDPIAQVEAQANRILGSDAPAFRQMTQDSSQAKPREGLLTFVPYMPGTLFNPPQCSVLWLESVHHAEFQFRVSPDLNGQFVRGRLTIFLGTIILGEVPLSIHVQNHAGTVPPESVTSSRYRKIFASYSHRDWFVVNDFNRYARALGDEYLIDIAHLHAGEAWTDRIYGMIREADVFQLFWSSNSMYSQFVQREWQYALSLRRPQFVRPVYWEDPLPNAPERNLPPPELTELHFQRIPTSSSYGSSAVAKRMPERPPSPASKASQSSNRSKNIEATPAREVLRDEVHTSTTRINLRTNPRKKMVKASAGRGYRLSPLIAGCLLVLALVIVFLVILTTRR